MASNPSYILLLVCLLAPESHLFMFNGGVTGVATFPWYDYTTEEMTTAAERPTTCPPPPTCGTCPENYRSAPQLTYDCHYRCICLYDPPTTPEVITTEATTTEATTSEATTREATTTAHVATTRSSSKSILLSILRNIQNNAAALEQMALGLSEDADLASNVANNIR